MPQAALTPFLDSLTQQEAQVLKYEWPLWARASQLPPQSEWLTWVIKAGRGAGKTRSAAEWVRSKAEQYPGCRIMLGGKSPDDYRDTMIQGESGILACSPPWFRPLYRPSLRMLIWPNKSIAMCFSGENPDALRGPQHHFAWVDEVCKFSRPQEFLDQLFLGLRLGERPQVMVTTTPRPIKAFIKLLQRKNTVVTGGSTYDNLDNLAPIFRDEILSQYEGTRLGRQELLAEVLTDTPGALWKLDALDVLRVRTAPELIRTAIAVDPATSNTETSDETGIMVAGIDAERHGYLLEDCSGKYSPGEWGRKVVSKFIQHNANVVIAEKNQGGDMVKHTIETAAYAMSREVGKEIMVPVHLVSASKGKFARAEPVAALHEQQRLHHVGSFPELEDQLTTYVPPSPSGDSRGMKNSPDRLDAYVYAFWGLLLDGPAQPGVFVL